MKTEFDGLLETLGTMNKALESSADATKKDDAAIAAGAAEDALAGGTGKKGDEKPGEPGVDDQPANMSKSFKVKLDDGTELDAFDGAEILKSLMDRVEGSEAATAGVLKGLTDYAGKLGEMVKSLSAQVAELSNTGRGRKAVVTVAHPQNTETGAKETLAKSIDQGVSPQEFLAKALTAQASGKISGRDVSIAEVCINQGQEIPADIRRAVLA